ncbi:MAG: alpha/beta hydrolase [Lachnospiraceae bacterium]|nr:alpha/beta hydrolase [Lachnospiraceae bacterium]
MMYETIDIKNKNSMEYAALHLFLFEDSPEIPIKTRPIVVICPGGGYEFTSDREADIIAVQYLSMGYHAAVLRYSVAPAVYPTALLELGRAVAVIRENADEWHIDRKKIVVSGFSAGGHLAANYAMFWNRDFLAEALSEEADGAKAVSAADLQPNAMILCYPVITSGEYAHEGSFRKLLGEDYEAKKEELSLELCVGDQVPRTFIWHTYEDDCVPVQNTLLLANALVQHHIPTEIHIFEKGGHGLSLGTRLTGSADGSWTQSEVAVWPQLVHTWMESWIAGAR